ncbi:MAG: (E)-4-hydroxy-3-methylbut-2-enyl-diphosphate synthase [Cyclobacteriaceae bacterium]|nr:(E)-4-hydroxy-3-methylbut-2-enyl-diphosphate synthase [Cyclobacteriaceae bacterium]
MKQYCNSMTAYSRRETREVYIGDIPLGGTNPIRVQSMTTVDTMNTQGSVEQAIRMIEAGCEYVRITAPSINEAANLENIKKELRKRGYSTPLVADIHFTPNAAELAARIVEKVRINPGNYADKKKFEQIRYTRETYLAELDRIRDKFTPLVKICKEYGTAMRIGTNHGSLSDRIMSRYGDTPLGMVESALEFVRICEEMDFFNIVLSMKASNPVVMVQAYRLLVNRLEEGGLQPYPLHLGVTEAGEAEDGRIKSAVGIGTLLEDGLGDTVRVSLTEEPEFEIPVAKILVDRYHERIPHEKIREIAVNQVDPFQYNRRKTREILNFGAGNVPRVIADYSHFPILKYEDLRPIGHVYLPEPDKFIMKDTGADYVYTGKQPAGFDLPSGLKEIQDSSVWLENGRKNSCFPMFGRRDLADIQNRHGELNFIRLNMAETDDALMEALQGEVTAVIVAETSNKHAYADLRRFFLLLMEHNIDLPVVISRSYERISTDSLLLYGSTDIGGLLIDGMGDGAMLSTAGDMRDDRPARLNRIRFNNDTLFGILQAARTRVTRTEYISCPSCGRTLFDLQETTARIRKRTDHLKGIKIGIMGCIVNGPGEMADADYGYVGSGKGKITLYRGKEVVKRSVPAGDAVDELISLIAEDGKWIEPSAVLDEENKI